MVRLGAALAAAGVVFAACGAPAGAVVVSAAVSLTDALGELARAYEAGSGMKIVLNFGPSNALARQLVGGAPVDLFISADPAQMRTVQNAGLVIERSRVDLLSNVLVVVMPAARAKALGSPRDLLDPAVARIAIANPDGVPAGVYARRYLEGLGLWRDVSRKVVPTLSPRAALAAADAGNVDAAIVYRTDAAMASDVRIVFTVPRGSGPSIVYPAAVLKTGRNRAGAERFLAFLCGSDARRTFERFGFLPMAGAPPHDHE